MTTRRRPTLPAAEAEAASIRALKEALSNLPHDKKSALVHVQRVAPALVDDAHFLIFLREVGFYVKVSRLLVHVLCDVVGSSL